VINESPHVKAETRQQVLVAIQELGYVVNKQAQSLAAGGRSQMIGVLVPDFGTGYTGETIRGIDAELTQRNREMVLYTTHRIANKEAKYITNLIKSSVAGLLMVLPINSVENIGSLIRQNFPYVLIDHQGSRQDCPAVGATNRRGGYDATEYLIGLGHNRIGFITGTMSMGCSMDRLDGYRAALEAHRIPFSPELVFEGDYSQPLGFAGASKLLDLALPPTAIFASNDVMAIGAIDAVRNRGMRVPEDISIIGFDDVPQATQSHPPLTTIRQPLETMGRESVQILLDLLEHPGKKVNRIELPTELVIRGTCAPPNGKKGK
jgi:LacI family transcriptional regulator